MAAWCEAPHSCPNCLVVVSSRWDREGVVKSTDMLALGDPPFKNSSFFTAADTSSCRFPSSLDAPADEFRNYAGLPSCCYWVEQALLRPSSWPHHCPECYREREEGRKSHQRPASHPSGALDQAGEIDHTQRNHSRTMIEIVHRCKITHSKMSYKMMVSIKWWVELSGKCNCLESRCRTSWVGSRRTLF